MSDSWRTIRVFVSSTFCDMHEEREELVKRVFPQLRKLCEARGVTFGDVDLRWGVMSEQNALPAYSESVGVSRRVPPVPCLPLRPEQHHAIVASDVRGPVPQGGKHGPRHRC
ncbi:MAG: DUF4062 domain-containing protein [Planctomycetes bacterium]|nr:DUF4062 domain-containing protein [Planctomycetota bacterium]